MCRRSFKALISAGVFCLVKQLAVIKGGSEAPITTASPTTIKMMRFLLDNLAKALLPLRTVRAESLKSQVTTLKLKPETLRLRQF
jgi:hypothetical protein